VKGGREIVLRGGGRLDGRGWVDQERPRGGADGELGQKGGMGECAAGRGGTSTEAEEGGKMGKRMGRMRTRTTKTKRTTDEGWMSSLRRGEREDGPEREGRGSRKMLEWTNK